MTQVILTEQQAKAVAGADDGVEFLDNDGRMIACVTPEALEFAKHVEIARARRANPGPGIPSERVEALLRKFHEIDAQQGMTREKMQELLRRSRAGDSL